MSFFPNGHRRLDRFRLGLGRLPGQDHRKENAVLPVHRDHPVRQGRVVVDAVALVQDLRMIADLHLQRTGKYQIKLLPPVAHQMDRFVLLLFGVFIADPVRLRHLVFELGRQVRDGDALLLRGSLALAAAGHRVGRQKSVMTFQQFRQFHVEGLGGFVDEGEGHVRLSCFIQLVFVRSDFRLLCHFLRSPAHNLPHLTQAGSNRLQLVEIGLGIHHVSPPIKNSFEIK